MQFEHEEFRRLLERIASHLASASEPWRDAVRRLKEGLIAHNLKEERILYPMGDQAALRAGTSEALAESLRVALRDARP
jgi:hypothetical protein